MAYPLPSTCARHHDHSRRHFLRDLFGVGAGTLVLGKLPVQALGASPLLAALAEAPEDRVLVLLRLKGGNDGLNTCIPLHDFGTYRAARPRVHVPEQQALKLTADLALHPRLAPFRDLWEGGALRVVRNVGYPGQSLSHFRSADIWATGSGAEEVVGSGVLGRYLAQTYPDYLSNPPDTPPAIQIGGAGNLLFNGPGDFNYAVSTNDPEKLYEIARTGRLYDLGNLPDCGYGEQLGYLRAVANTTFRYAGVLADTYAAGRNDGDYLDDPLGRQLALVARLLRGGLRTRLFVVELDGFDTHANQPDAHAALLDSVARNGAQFYADLGRDGTDQRVLTMTFSEFGRRVAENGSAGTDHGAGAPLFVVSPGLAGNGSVGPPPDLGSPDRNGNLQADTDFRAVYATVLSRWLCLDDELVDTILGAAYPRIDGLGLSCAATTSVATSASRYDPGLVLQRRGNEVVISYTLETAVRVDVYLYDALGRRLRTVFSGRQSGGPQELTLQSQYVPGLYVVSLETGGRAYGKKLPLF